MQKIRVNKWAKHTLRKYKQLLPKQLSITLINAAKHMPMNPDDNICTLIKNHNIHCITTTMRMQQ